MLRVRIGKYFWGGESVVLLITLEKRKVCMHRGVFSGVWCGRTRGPTLAWIQPMTMPLDPTGKLA